MSSEERGKASKKRKIKTSCTRPREIMKKGKIFC